MKANKRTNRLLSRPEFRTVYERGQKFSSPYYSAFIIRTDSTQQRLGLTTTRKVGKAVLRNRCRRRIRELFRLRDRSVLAEVGFDIVFNLRASAATADFHLLEAAFNQTLQRFRQSINKTVDLVEAG